MTTGNPSDSRFSIERHEGADRSGQLTLLAEGQPLGTLDYRRNDRVVHIDYVEVTPSARGGGHGQRLVEAAVAWAREENLRLVPICGFARRVLVSNPAFADVLAGASRS